MYSGSDKISTNKTYTISETLTQNSYDYLIVQLSGFGSGGGFSTGGTFIMTWEPNKLVPSWYGAYSFEEDNSSTMNGVIIIDGNTLYFYPNPNSNVGFQCINKVIGIKKNSLSTADIAEMAMPSKINITIPDIIDDSTYTATANGLILVQAIPSNSSLASVYIRTLDSNSNIIRTSRNINYGSIGSIFCSHTVAKGDTIAFGLSNCTASSVKFFYSIGDAKALGLI